MGQAVKIPARPGHRNLIVGNYYEHEDVWYFTTGLFNAWEYFSPERNRSDPPIIKPDIREWLVEHKINLQSWEERGVLQLEFHDPDVFILFKLTWL